MKIEACDSSRISAGTCSRWSHDTTSRLNRHRFSFRRAGRDSLRRSDWLKTSRNGSPEDRLVRNGCSAGLPAQALRRRTECRVSGGIVRKGPLCFRVCRDAQHCRDKRGIQLLARPRWYDNRSIEQRCDRIARRPEHPECPTEASDHVPESGSAGCRRDTMTPGVPPICRPAR